VSPADAPDREQTSGPIDPADALDEDCHVLVVDNYDSFVYNLVQYVGELAETVTVRRNDELTLPDVHALDPTAVVVSPGPGTPADAGLSIPLFEATTRPILGVCLGHQALCAAHGAPVEQAPAVVHGKSSVIEHRGGPLFDGVPRRLQVGRYHSLAVERDRLPDSLVETATTVDQETALLMAVRHREHPHFGVQFHPESILTGSDAQTTPRALTTGKRLVANFLSHAVDRTDD
jgi:anthranilate synthase component 2